MIFFVSLMRKQKEVKRKEVMVITGFEKLKPGSIAKTVVCGVTWK